MDARAKSDDGSAPRRHLLTGQFGSVVERIESHRIRLEPGQRAPLHEHPGGVMGYVEAGDIVLQVAGEAPVSLGPGDVFHEPPGARIARFDNVSTAAPAQFVAFYPLTGDQPLATLLEPTGE